MNFIKKKYNKIDTIPIMTEIDMIDVLNISITFSCLPSARYFDIYFIDVAVNPISVSLDKDTADNIKAHNPNTSAPSFNNIILYNKNKIILEIVNSSNTR